MTIKEGTGIQVACVSTFPPRQCGLATFTADLTEAMDAYRVLPPVRMVAVTDNNRYLYDHRVKFEIEQDDFDSYLEAARYLNRSHVDLVHIQHEFGIFGGRDGEFLIPFLEALRKPVAVTLHSVMLEPGIHRRDIIRQVAAMSRALVVMADKGKEILSERYGIPPEKIHVIPHGVPVTLPWPPEDLKRRYGCASRQVLCTFGLLNPGKGIEHVLRALPAVVARHPQVLYLVLGQTHPMVRKHSGESYRDGLYRLVDELGLAEHVRFVARYLTKEELLHYLTLTDVYITPYTNPEQICSGTLAYALCLGKAIISTPYLYARELLAEERGLVVPFADPGALAGALNSVLGDPARQQCLQENARAYGREMIWPRVAARYIGLFTGMPAADGVGTGRPAAPAGGRSVPRYA